MKTRSKQQKDEAFPVASLMISKSLRPVVSCYYNFARYADDIADNPKLSKAEKLKQLNEIEDIFLGSKDYSSKKLYFARELRKIFRIEGLSISLVTDLIIAFKRDSEEFKYQTWGQLVDYCNYSAAPVGRFMLAVHNENPSTYIPSASVCIALQLVNHLTDIKYDFQKLNRVYLPQELMDKYGVTTKDLKAKESSPGLKNLIRHISNLAQGQLKDGELLVSIIKNKRLRIQVSIILSLTNIMLKKINTGDVLMSEIKLSRIDWLKAILTGLTKGIFTKRKTLGTNYEQY